MSLIETRSRGNAPDSPAGALQPSTTLSRRAALRGAASAALGLGTSAYTSAQSKAAGLSPDAALIDLARQLEALIGREREAWDRHSTAEDAAFKATPPAPICRKVVDPFDAGDAMAPLERIALYMGPNSYSGDMAAARAEHATAMAEHARTVAAIEKRHGVHRLERQACRLSNQVIAASARLAEMQASTSAGLAAKACPLLAITGGDRLSQRAELENHMGLFESLLEDAARLGQGGAA